MTLSLAEYHLAESVSGFSLLWKKRPIRFKTHTELLFNKCGLRVHRYPLLVSTDLCRAKQFGLAWVSRNWSVRMWQNQFVLFVPLQQNSRRRGCAVPSADLSIGVHVGVSHISHHEKRWTRAPYLQTQVSAQDEGGRPRATWLSVRLSAEEKFGVYAHFCVCRCVCVCMWRVNKSRCV